MTNQLLITSIILSVAAILILGYVVYTAPKSKEGLCLCDNLGNKKVKHVEMNNPYVLNYQYPSPF